MGHSSGGEVLNDAEHIARAPAWQREKALALHGICGAISNAIDSGMAQRAAVQNACTDHAGQLLSDGKGGHKTLKLSASTMTRHFTNWKKAGESMSVFLPDYKPGKVKVPRELIMEFQRLCTLPGVSNMSVAIDTLKKQWQNGEDVPGLGRWPDWWPLNRKGFALPADAPDFPVSSRALYRYRPSRAAIVTGTKGIAAARKELPWLTRDTSKLRPGECYMFDDVRLDILAIDDITKRPTELNAYIAYEVGCRVIPSFILRPANAMLKPDVDGLVVRTLKAFGIGKTYTTHLVFERGTLTMSPVGKEFLEKVTEGRIQVHYSSMNTGKRYVGAHRDAGVGHWMGKAVIESLMRKIHLELMSLPGQRGNDYTNQPANLGWNGQGNKPTPGTLAREASDLAEIVMWSDSRFRLDLGLMWASQVNAMLRKAVARHNSSRGHDYQGFGKVTEKESAPGVWRDVVCN